MNRYLSILLLLLLSSLVSGCVDTKDSQNYSLGYDMGYHNHNDSNYMICKEYYCHSWNGSYDEYVFDFAYGYMKGYEQYVRDGETLRIVYIRNGSL